jgi:hypothetical protein
MPIGTLARRHLLHMLASLPAFGFRAVTRQAPDSSLIALLQELRMELVNADEEAGAVPGKTGVGAELGVLEKAIKPGVPVPAAARLALDDLRFALTSSATVASTRASVAVRVAQDIRIKAGYCRAHPRGVAALVRLTVRTWAEQPAGRSEQGDWQVLYVSTPQTLLPSFAGRSFPRFSSPTVADLAPGLWSIWAQHPRNSALRGPIRELVLGATPGADTAEADLLVPVTFNFEL